MRRDDCGINGSVLVIGILGENVKDSLFVQVLDFGNKIKRAGTHRFRDKTTASLWLPEKSMMDNCQITNLVRCGGLSIVPLSSNRFEPQRTLP